MGGERSARNLLNTDLEVSNTAFCKNSSMCTIRCAIFFFSKMEEKHISVDVCMWFSSNMLCKLTFLNRSESQFKRRLADSNLIFYYL